MNDEPNTHTLTFRVPQSMTERLIRASYANKESVAAFLRRAAARELKREERKQERAS